MGISRIIRLLMPIMGHTTIISTVKNMEWKNT